jgi:hypothetical protein
MNDFLNQPLTPLNVAKVIATVEGQDFTFDGTVIRFKGRARVDNDGTGPSQGDPDHQNDTSLHGDGKPLNADVDLFIVLPPQVIAAVAGICLGAQAYVSYNGKRIAAVVGDVGPRGREGEDSDALLLELGLSDNPFSGGDDLPDVDYEVYPGVPAMTQDGTRYELQAA